MGVMDYLSGRCVFCFAIGGGGDVATAAMLSLALRRHGFKSYVGSVVWERYVVDPTPGPIRFDDVLGGKYIGNYSILVDGRVKAVKGGREVVFQAVNTAKVLKEPVAIVDISKGVYGVWKGLEEVLSYFGCDSVLSVDVGGDVLATGFEDELWSPLADFIGLTATTKVKGVIAVHSPGSDGELSQEYVLSRISLIARHNGYLGIRAVDHEDIKNLEMLLELVESEASRVTLLAYRGDYGFIELRGGSRRTYITPLNLLTFLLKSEKVYELNPVAKTLEDTKDVDEARKKLNSLGITTELDLEEEIYKLILKEVRVSGDVLIGIKERLKERISKG